MFGDEIKISNSVPKLPFERQPLFRKYVSEQLFKVTRIKDGKEVELATFVARHVTHTITGDGKISVHLITGAVIEFDSEGGELKFE